MSDFQLPEPPPNHFWRITRTLGMPGLQLRRKVWIFSVCVDDIIPVGDSPPERRIMWAAKELLDRVEQRKRNQAFTEQHYGDKS